MYLCLTVSSAHLRTKRGNAESLLCALTLAVAYFLQRGRNTAAAIVFGTAVHFKIYPVLYAVPIVVYLGGRGLTRGDDASRKGDISSQSDGEGTVADVIDADEDTESIVTKPSVHLRRRTRAVPRPSASDDESVSEVAVTGRILSRSNARSQSQVCGVSTRVKREIRAEPSLLSIAHAVVSPSRVRFAFISASTFFALTGLMYYM